MGRVRYNIALVVANILFGANFSFYVSLTRYYLNFQQIFMLQVTVAAIFFIPFALFSRRSWRITVEDFGTIFIVALLVIYGWMYMLLWGASQTSPIDASTIATLGPVFTLIVAHIVTPQPISWIKSFGAVVAIAGAMVLLSDRGHDMLSSTTEAFGNALVLCAVVAIAANTVLINNQLKRYGSLTIMGWYYIIGFVMVAPFFWGEIKGINPLKLPFGAIMELCYVIFLGTILPMWLLYVGSANLTAVHTALYRYIQPVVATILSLLRGQNRIDRTNIAGAVLIFTGVVFVVAGNIIRKRLSAPAESPAIGKSHSAEPPNDSRHEP
ncbi:MAG: DMT family transporter [Alistipes sp.]|nr:DMT family transporter [Alistipes sp.]